MFHFIQNLKVKAKLSLLVGLFVLGFGAFGVFSYKTLNTVKVNGPIYLDIVQGKDLVADILPPPEYIIESYLVVLQTVEALQEGADKAKLEALAERGKALRAEYDTRHQFWIEDLVEGTMKETMVVKSYQPALEFFEARDKEFVPAVLAGDIKKAEAIARGVIKKKYEEHRAAIDEVVQMATEKVQADERKGADIIKSGTSVLIALGVGIVAIVFLLSWFIANGIAKPLGQTVAVLQDIAEGEGDLTKRLEVKSQDEIGELARWFNVFMDKLHDIIGQVKGTADHVAAASQELSAASEQLSSGTQEQASSLEETAASLEEFTSTIKQTADNAKQANQLAVGSRDMADKGGRVVTNAVTAMGEINHSSRKIADIITAIDEIAFQTNLLALNAAVEAARAGEQGRGFAVVATEVRNLAQRSAGAAKEIKGLIQDSVQKVQTGSELVNQSGQTLDEIVGSVKRVTDIIAEITAASQEQSLGIDQVNKAVGQMDQVTQATAAQTEELSSTAQSLSAQAQQLQALVGRFKLAQSGLTTTPSVGVYGGVTPPSTPALSKVRMKKAAPVPVSAPAGGANGSTHELADGFEEF